MPLYPRAPIVEAVIDIRLSKPLRESVLAKMTHILGKNYPIVQDCTNNLQIELQKLRPTPKVKIKSDSKIGRKFSRNKGDAIIQVYPDQFVFSMFAKYEGWDIYKNAFDTAIKDFLPKSGNGIQRIGMRYINRIDIPHSTTAIKIDDFVNLSFNSPIGNNTVEGFETALRFVLSEKHAALVRVYTNESPLPDHASIYVDIDVFYPSDSSIEINSLNVELDELRNCKNSIFEALVTDRSRELFLKDVEE